jgi:Acetyltransferase (GNAT) domain
MIHVHHGHQLPDELPSPDVYFTPGYGRAATVADAGEWVLLEAFDGAWQVPLIVRTLVDGMKKDAISPYGYSGLYASPSLSSVQVQEAWSATVNCLRQLDVISVLLRHSPLVPQASDLPGLRSIISGHPTIVLEPGDTESAWSGMAGTCRTRIRKALKNGYTGNVGAASCENLAPSGGFRRLYEQTMQRLDAAPLYFFSDAYYKALLDGLGSNLLIAEVRDRAGLVASSALLMRHGKRLHYHLAGSNVDDSRMGSNNLMMWTATQYAAEQGLRQFHLGGGISQRDSLFKFKHTFGGRELNYDVSGVIVDHELYEAQTKRRAKACKIATETLLATDYFPAYRGGETHV